MPLSITKETNQYFGKYFENAICSAINHTAFYNCTDYNDFTNEDIAIMNSDAEKVANFLNVSSAKWVGNYTSIQNCDIIADGNSIEIKYVSSGTGTYFNTTIYELEKYGFDLRTYMANFGLYNALIDNFSQYGIKVSKTNKSPVSQTSSSIIRHQYDEIYKRNIIPIEQKMRQQFLLDLIKYFQHNTDELYHFLINMINKETTTIVKNKPDQFIVYNYNTKTISKIDLTQINMGNLTITLTDKGFIVGDIRVQIGWQNGNGLNNPTIRIFLKG